MLRMSRPALATWPSALCRPRCGSQLAAQRNRRSLWPPQVATDGAGDGDVDVDGVGAEADAEAGAWPAAAETQKERHRMVLLYCECDYLKDMQ